MTTRSSLKVLRPLAVGALALALATPAVAVPLDPGTPTQQQVDAAKAAAGEERIFGVMIESHLKEGRQDLTPGKLLEYGVSVTDACLGWDHTLVALDILAKAVKARRVALAER